MKGFDGISPLFLSKTAKQKIIQGTARASFLVVVQRLQLFWGNLSVCVKM